MERPDLDPGSRLTRWWRHLWTFDSAARRAVPEDDLARIESAIAQGEARHSAEVRFAIEAKLDGELIWRRVSARARARSAFAELGVWNTEGNNGVLLYLLLADRAVEIVADREVMRRIGNDPWRRICDELAACCARGNHTQGVIRAVEQLHSVLEAHFPPGASNPDELPNRPVRL